MSIFEQKTTDPSVWGNHSFIRTLNEYTDLLGEYNENKDFLAIFYEYIYDHAIPLMILGGIILGTFLSLRKIHKNNLKRGLEEFKKIQKEENYPSHKLPEKKNQTN